MKKILVLLLALVMALGLTACSGDNGKKEPVSVDLENKEIYEMPDYVQNYLEEEMLEETYQALNTDEGILLFVARGEKLTGGYTVGFSEANITDNKLYVEVTVEDPAEGSMVTQAITYPFVLAMVDGENIPNTVIFIDSVDKKEIQETTTKEVLQPKENIALIYFGTPEGYLRAEAREIQGEVTGDSGKELIEEIIKGTTATDDTSNVLPEETKVLAYQFDGETGIATIDLSDHINQVQGSMGESLAVYAIVNTLTELPGVEKVQVLVEGEIVDQIAGHIYLRDPLEREPVFMEDNLLK